MNNTQTETVQTTFHAMAFHCSIADFRSALATVKQFCQNGRTIPILSHVVMPI